MYGFSEPTTLPLFSILGIPVYPFACFVALGAVLALIMALVRAGKTGLDGGAMLLFAMLAIPLGVILGRAAFCLCRMVDVLDFGFSYVYRIDYGGFSILGVAAGMALAAWLTKVIARVSFLDVLDTVMPGLLIVLALERFAEGSTINGTGPEITVAALQFAPLARQGLYGEYTYAVHMGEAITALVAGVYTQSMGKRARGLAGATGVILVAAAQILWESARRDEVLKFDFVRYTMVASGVVLLLILILSLLRTGWPLGGKVLTVAGFLFLVLVCIAMEFFIDGKFLQNVPIWFCYLCDLICTALMAVICLRALHVACEE